MRKYELMRARSQQTRTAAWVTGAFIGFRSTSACARGTRGSGRTCDAPDRLRREVRFSQMRYFSKHRPRWERAVIRALNRAYFLAHGWTWR